MDCNRRFLLKSVAAAGAAAAVGEVAEARARVTAPPDALGLLYDTTKCIGCKTCVVACREANGTRPDTENAPGGLWDMPMDLNGDTKTIIKLYKSADGQQRSYLKAQCMQCVDPACTNACMLGALKKLEHGIVAYDANLCIGCRYCQTACPFNVPKFEWGKAAAKIVKCELCRQRAVGAALTTANGFSRYPKGKGPACAEVCPREAVIYGTRDELLHEARRRMKENAGRYVPKIYGETEAGGTQVLYLSHVPFENLALPTLSDEPVPYVQQTLQHGLYQHFIGPVAVYGFLAAVVFRNRRKAAVDEERGKGGAS
jgi:Fe-S-cluster-containing dehydrogenase component